MIPLLPAMPADVVLNGRPLTLTPRWGCLLFRRIADAGTHATTAGGLWIPQQTLVEQQQLQAEVIGRGEGVEDAHLLPGVRVITRRFGKSMWLDDDETVFEAPERFVQAVVLTVPA